MNLAFCCLGSYCGVRGDEITSTDALLEDTTLILALYD